MNKSSTILSPNMIIERISTHQPKQYHKTETSQKRQDPVISMCIQKKEIVWDGVERRSSNSCRRQNSDRRKSQERRRDIRIECNCKRSVKARIRSIISGRLGVDRRKGGDRRMIDRRCCTIHSLVSPEELEALLS